MICGIVACESDAGISGPPPAPPTLRGVLDFVNGIYTFDASTLSLASVVDLTGRRSGSGLEIIAGTPVQLLGAPLAFVLAANWTIVIQFNYTTTVHTHPGRNLYLLTMFDAGFNDQVAIFTIGDAFIGSDLAEDAGSGNTRECFGDDSFPQGPVYRIAATRNTAHIAVSLAGEAMVLDAVNSTSINISSWTFPPTQVQLADGNQTATHEGFIEKISFYDPVADSLLPSLSA